MYTIRQSKNPSIHFFFNCMQFLGKNYQNNSLAPPPVGLDVIMQHNLDFFPFFLGNCMKKSHNIWCSHADREMMSLIINDVTDYQISWLAHLFIINQPECSPYMAMLEEFFIFRKIP